MKTLRKSIVYILTGFLAGITLFLIVFFTASPSETPVITSTSLKNALEEASDLITMRYDYSNIGKYENSLELNGWTIPFTQKRFILTYQGEVSFGIDVSEINVFIQGNTITVECPGIQVLSNQILEDSIEVYDESQNIFNPIQVSDYLAFCAAEKQTVLEKMETEGIYQKARDYTEKSIKQLLYIIPQISENYTITVSFPESAS